MLTAKEIRESFKSFFNSKGHQIVPSAPMVIKDDPTLMLFSEMFRHVTNGSPTPKNVFGSVENTMISKK